jgi:hypothetical protein
VTFDADGQHRAADIAVLIDALARQDADFALGSRFLGTSLNQPLSRRMLLKAATLFTRLTTGLRVTDTHNGLRAMTRRGASSIKLHQNRMAHASEILHQIAASGLNYVEAPVRIEYSAYSLAKGQTLGDTLMILVDLFAEAPPMIAQLILTALLLGILLYALTEYRRSPAVGLIAVLAAVGGLYFVWVPSHATHLAEFVSIGRGVDLIIYIWIVISLLLLLNLHLKLRAHMELITVLARELAIASARSHRSTS